MSSSRVATNKVCIRADPVTNTVHSSVSDFHCKTCSNPNEATAARNDFNNLFDDPNGF